MTISTPWTTLKHEGTPRFKLGKAVKSVLFRLFQDSRYGIILKEHLDAAMQALGECTQDYVAEEIQRQSEVEGGTETLARMAAINLSRGPLMELSAEADRVLRDILRDAIERAVLEHRADLRHVLKLELDEREHKEVTEIYFSVLSKQLVETEKVVSNIMERNGNAAIKIMQKIQDDLLQQELD